jgi:uncharacterized protein YndB with AHSA1/START domain
MSSTAGGDARVLGSLRQVGGKGAARLQDRFDTDVDDLWSALTDPGRLARWLGEVEGDLRLGGQFRARFSPPGGKAPGGCWNANRRSISWSQPLKRTSRTSTSSRRR